MKKKLFKFLKDNNCLVEFLINLSAYNKKEGCNLTIHRLTTISNPIFIISYAFFWHNTTEGHDYWLDISRKWSNYLNINHFILYIMTDQLISFETAKLAQEKGFHTEMKPYYKECTQSLLQKWLREKHNILLAIYPGLLSLTKPIPNKTIIHLYTWKIIIPNPYNVYQSKKRVESYEEALEQGLKKALLLIK